DPTNQNFSDLWMYDPTLQVWTWMGGPNTASTAAPVYGTRGAPAANNTPGGRSGASTWADNTGHLWLFGGNDYPNPHILADLWSYDTATDQWTWVSGSSTAGAAGIYGTQGISAAGNTPGARTNPGSWVDAAGHFWMFGGSGTGDGTSGSQNWLSDLW